MGETRNLSKERRENLLKKIDELRVFFNTNEDIEKKERTTLLNHLFDIEKEVNNKKYGLVYEEHEEEIDRLLKTHIPVLTEDEKLYIDNGGQMNFILEGDNLASLKLLEKTHKGKIDVIYIDPPYNTGNKDFIYNDDIVGEDDGYRHSKWISFIIKRIEIAKNLLNDEGILFISIDDNELVNLKMICNNVFGEENFSGQYMWYKSATPPNLSYKIKKNLEYILCYEKKKNNIKYKGLSKVSPSDDPFTKPQNTLKKLLFKPYSINFKGEDGIIKAGTYGTKKFPNILLNDLIIKNGRNVNEACFENRFIWTQETLDKNLKESLKVNLSKQLVLSYKKANYDPEVPPNLIDDSVGVDTTEEAGKKLDLIFNKNKVFDYPKPVNLLNYLLGFNGKKEEIVLDFFAGSGTTGQAVLELNKEDGGNRKFILCTNTEATEDEPKKNIARDITYQRIKTVITGKRKDKTKYSDGLAGSLKYMKVDYIDTQDKLYEDYQYDLETHMKELLELQYGINMNDSEEYKLLLTEDDKDDFCDKIIKDIDKYKKNNKLKKVFIGNDILFDIKLETLHEELGVEIVEIPASYYEEV